MKIADARSKPSLGSVGRAPTLAQAQCTATVRAVLFQVRLRTSCAGKARRRGSTRADGWRRGRLRRALRGPGGTRRRRCSLRGPTTGTTRAGCCPCPLTSAWPACWSCCRSPACRCELAPRPPPAPPPRPPRTRIPPPNRAAPGQAEFLEPARRPGEPTQEAGCPSRAAALFPRHIGPRPPSGSPFHTGPAACSEPRAHRPVAGSLGPQGRRRHPQAPLPLLCLAGCRAARDPLAGI